MTKTTRQIARERSGLEAFESAHTPEELRTAHDRDWRARTRKNSKGRDPLSEEHDRLKKTTAEIYSEICREKIEKLEKAAAQREGGSE